MFTRRVYPKHNHFVYFSQLLIIPIDSVASDISGGHAVVSEGSDMEHVRVGGNEVVAASAQGALSVGVISTYVNQGPVADGL